MYDVVMNSTQFQPFNADFNQFEHRIPMDFATLDTVFSTFFLSFSAEKLNI